MKFRRRRVPVLLFLIPSLASAVAAAGADATSALTASTQTAPAWDEAATLTTNAKLKSEVGTKDAPVDGLDGKPHAGPWVEAGAEKDKKKLGEEVEAKSAPAVGGKPGPKLVEASAARPKAATDTSVPDSVMDDPNRESPEKGTTGTEGGVSEKDRDRKKQEGETGKKTEKKPDPPKEPRPLPHSEETKIKHKDGGSGDGGKETGKEKGGPAEETSKQKELGGLAKPTDLPEKPHDMPLPLPPSSTKDDPLTAAKGGVGAATMPRPVDDGLIQPLHSFALSLAMILFSEIGDKTFLIAALMAMKHPRLLVFSAAFSALIAMTVLSAVLGHAVPTLIPKRFTSFLAAALFLVFGARMLREGYGMGADEGVGEEMREVEMELEEKEQLARRQGRRRSELSPYVLEAGRGGSRKARSDSRLPSPPRSPSSSRSRSRSRSPAASTATTILAGAHNLSSLLLSPAWVQTFVMTFLGEWGDRSQIATIAMAAGQDYWWVTAGAVLGHAVCTAAAVIGGRAVAGRVSLRVVTLGGGFAFLAFGLIYLVEATYYG
ncbi:MAG: hypothetical protein M1832_000623 [Thelocarpon impressellum]|nr:MAG: hypothetical protein M1832_000623 [Thelocarpon impressellum]